jgi:hypothetical protein
VESRNGLDPTGRWLTDAVGAVLAAATDHPGNGRFGAVDIGAVVRHGSGSLVVAAPRHTDTGRDTLDDAGSAMGATERGDVPALLQVARGRAVGEGLGWVVLVHRGPRLLLT